MEPVAENTKAPSPMKKNKKSKKKTMIALMIAVVSVLTLLFLINATQAMVLKVYLKNRWEDVGGRGNLRILEFSNNTITYRMSHSEPGTPLSEQRAAATTVATYKYKAISRTKIKVLRENGNWETITVEFPFAVMSDYSYMELCPALTTDAKTETWSYY